MHLLALPGRFWKWRMQGGAITLGRKAAEIEGGPDAILATDMLNVPVFLAAWQRVPGRRRAVRRVPLALYFHENQLTYPLPPGEKRDLHYGFVNYASALCADALWFNSQYHLDAFFDELPRLLKHFPDYNELWSVGALRARARVLPLGLSLERLDAHRPASPRQGPPVLLWNHRWEYDKDPAAFFAAVDRLVEEGLDLRLIVLGESFRNQPGEFLEARGRLGERILHFGYAEDDAAYARLLWQADVVVSTALHEFFGAAVVEACYCDCFPVLPARLSYPELLPPSHHECCLYRDADGLVERLRDAIQNVEGLRNLSLRPHVARYDWGQMAPQYDDLLSGLGSHF